MKIEKAAGITGGGIPTPEQMEQVNAWTKTPLKEDEVYVFSVRLCDDQVDRDYERFSAEALEKLAPMFLGKTGIADHAWSSEKQVARIFDTSVEYENGVCYLKAWAYLLRTEKNLDLIRELEGGIKKEVSVGCAMERAVCSICGADYGTCEHRKGEYYGAELCTAVLCEPKDAYEFSFVAVPAQKDAGVLKKMHGEGMPDSAELKKLQQEAALGRQYRKELEKRLVSAALLLDLGLNETVAEAMAKALSSEDLQSAEKALTERAAKRFPPVCQLQNDRDYALEADSAFLI